MRELSISFEFPWGSYDEDTPIIDIVRDAHERGHVLEFTAKPVGQQDALWWRWE